MPGKQCSIELYTMVLNSVRAGYNNNNIIIRKTGTISKSLRKHLSKIPGKHKIKKLQKTHTSESNNVEVQKI
jgi:hypothetical protein